MMVRVFTLKIEKNQKVIEKVLEKKVLKNLIYSVMSHNCSFPDDSETLQKAETFTQMFQERQPADSFISELKTAEGDEMPYNSNDFGIFVMVMLKMASKTYSHNFSALSRYLLNGISVIFTVIFFQIPSNAENSVRRFWRLPGEAARHALLVLEDESADAHDPHRQTAENASARLPSRRRVALWRENVEWAWQVGWFLNCAILVYLYIYLSRNSSF